MSTININSSDIRIFPISFDRSEGASYRIWVRNSETPPHTASNELKNYVANSTYIIGSLPSIEGIGDYYNESASSKALQASYCNGRVLSEGNISKLISALTDHTNFVINHSNSVIEFVIKGHYFKVALPEGDLRTNCYVGVNFTDDHNVYETLAAYDTDNGSSIDVLKNVDFSTEALTEGTREGEYDAVLHLLKGGDVPIASQFKFTSRSIKNIKGGTV